MKEISGSTRYHWPSMEQFILLLINGEEVDSLTLTTVSLCKVFKEELYHAKLAGNACFSSSYIVQKVHNKSACIVTVSDVLPRPSYTFWPRISRAA